MRNTKIGLSEKHRWSWMPSYKKCDIAVYETINNPDIAPGPFLQEIAKFRVKSIPLGFRGIWGLGRLFHLLPYLTGTEPTFGLQITRLSQSKGDDPFTFMILYRVLHSETKKDEIEGVFNKPIREDRCYYVVKDTMIGQSGEYTYDLTIFIGEEAKSHSTEMVGFRAICKEDVGINVIYVLIGAIVGAIITLITLLLTRK